MTRTHVFKGCGLFFIGQISPKLFWIMKWFWSFSFAKCEGKISKKLPDFYIWVSMSSQKYRRTIKVLYCIYGLQPDVAKSSHGWLSLWLQTKTPQKNNVMLGEERESLVYSTFALFYLASTFMTIKELGYLGSSLLLATSDND